METLCAYRIVCANGADARWISIEDGVIAHVGRDDPPADAVALDGAVLVPGFIDVQINGIGDVDFSRTDAAGFARATKALLRHGVTTFLPTLISAPLETYAPALETLESAGAFGVHLEGPFLGGAPGAHRREFLVEADPRWLRALLDDHGSSIRIVTLAPEADPGLESTRLLSQRGVVASVGHSTATYEDTRAAADAGARAVTHLFNAMGPLHHREPGVAGAALVDDRLTPTLIADLVHVHPVPLRLAVSRKRDVALVSDAIAIDAEWAASRGVREVDGAPRLADGTLAGSMLTLDRAVRNMVSIGVALERAVEMATEIPAALLGLDDRGVVATGKRADLVALDARTLEVRAVWHAGERVHGS